MDVDRKAVCEECRKMVPVSDIRYLLKKDRPVPICSECRGQPKKEPPKRDYAKVWEVRQEKQQPASRTKGEYYCERCRYRFKYDPKGRTDLMCPYCSKADKIVLHRIPSADQLLKDSEGYM